MLVTVQSDNKTTVLALPDEVNGGHWLCDADGLRVAFANAKEGSWEFAPAPSFAFLGEYASEGCVSVHPGKALLLNLRCGSREWALVCRPGFEGDRTFSAIGLNRPTTLHVGRRPDCEICYPSPFVSGRHAVLEYENGTFSVLDDHSANGVFVNGERIPAGQRFSLTSGDVVGILGLVIVVGAGLLSFNNPENTLTVRDIPGVVPYVAQRVETMGKGNGPEGDADCFYPALRFARAVTAKEYRIDAPPQREQPDDTSIAMKIGPSLGMALASVLSAGISVMMIAEQGTSSLHAIPMVAMAVAMLMGSVLWPIVNSRMEAKRSRQKEVQRRNAYSQYLGEISSKLNADGVLQAEILRENRMSPSECISHAIAADELFMSRTSQHHDYLELRIGTGEEPLQAKLQFPPQQFQVEEDDLRDAVMRFSGERRVLKDVPLGFSLISRPVLGVVGSDELVRMYLRNLLAQVVSLHSYQDVKVVLLCDNPQRDYWRFVSYLPHCMDAAKSGRFFACGVDEATEVGLMLERVLAARQEEKRSGGNPRDIKPYFVLFCPSKSVYDRASIVESVLAQHENRGFSVVAAAHAMHALPKECRSVIVLEGQREGYLIDRDNPSGERHALKLDRFVDDAEAESLVNALSSIRLDEEQEQSSLPDRLGFLEMFGVSTVEHLNIATRWRENKAANSLAASVGLDEMGAPFLLNLHEDFHGPHGLIAGTTGSGKSEFIITYILSMAINYSPDEVAFVLIDYKGGGLANAFDNDRFHLPHLAGTITNLDGAAITRSLVSIKSELQRRQRLFNEAREVVGGDNVDIYKYLDLFRQGKVTEPCPHLFVVADEFAELKQQEPDFMDELISAARIGRSLGVHLILATQKPSGVVNDQIWSNARFKVCLKVADESDSKEMIRRPDAAEIALAGRFYLMVGYNELFAAGQSGYSGVRYQPGAVVDNGEDQSVRYISNTGRVLLSVKPAKKAAPIEAASELVTVLGELCRVAGHMGVKARRLWQDPLPAIVPLQSLLGDGKLGVTSRFDAVALAGLCDDPANQKQFPLELALMDEGNAVVYGTADSGVEAVVKAAIASLIARYDTGSLNLYLVDYGSQSLTAFAGAPQVGDVITVDDDEKVERFFGFMDGIIASRRKLFARYGGSFARYNAKHGDCPAIVVVLNGISAFIEANEKLEDRLTAFLRDSGQVGIRILVVSEGVSGLRMRMRSSFRQVLACNLADTDDYVTLFGSMRDRVIPRGFGRGLVQREESVFEFQAASLTDADEDEYEAVVSFCERLATKSADAAPAIPVAPEHVDADMLLEQLVPDKMLPFGVFHDSLEMAYLDFSEKCIDRCAAQKRKDLVSFASSVLEVAAELPGRQAALLDMNGLFSERPSSCELATRKDDQARAFLQGLISGGNREEFLLLVVTGMVNFLGRLPYEDASKVKDFLRSLRPERNVAVLLCDMPGDASCSYEDWFKAHSTNRDGLWVGPGVDSQSVISVNYSSNIMSSSQMDAGLGYWVEAGDTRLVHLVQTASSKEDEEE